MAETTTMTTRLSSDTKDALAKLAKESGQSVNAFTAQILQKYLDDLDAQAKPAEPKPTQPTVKTDTGKRSEKKLAEYTTIVGKIHRNNEEAIAAVTESAKQMFEDDPAEAEKYKQFMREHGYNIEF